ncbi:hypothetical protein GCM10009760_49670 [Kitasatospora kazusensis]|uniref:Uncharacterized protein n=1 Tax=Kitasatospora kazusensis TaxID=407974 RepID=A0ABP5LVB3_9ACTN
MGGFAVGHRDQDRPDARVREERERPAESEDLVVRVRGHHYDPCRAARSDGKPAERVEGRQVRTREPGPPGALRGSGGLDRVILLQSSESVGGCRPVSPLPGNGTSSSPLPAIRHNSPATQRR